MTELAYMVREDWGQDGTAMRQQSAVIRDWLGSPPYVFATADRKKYESHLSAEREFVKFVSRNAGERRIIEFGDLRRIGEPITRPFVILHPFKERDCELLRDVVTAESVTKLSSWFGRRRTWPASGSTGWAR